MPVFVSLTLKGEKNMNQDIFALRWNQIRNEVRKTWERFTELDVDEIEGKYDILISKLQEKYGYTVEEASQEANRFLEMVGKQVERFHL
jgi:uncharacterized protein YjbJ (UPF0337 family)